jgi:hypothetical protein
MSDNCGAAHAFAVGNGLNLLRPFRVRQHWASLIKELPRFGTCRTPFFQRQQSCRRQASTFIHTSAIHALAALVLEAFMQLARRQFLHLAAGAAALPAVSRVARAQTYPARPVRWIVGAAAGGVVDIYARLLGQWLSERLGQPVIIENRVGAGGNIATEALVKAAPDGYTLGSVVVTNAINATLYDKLSFNIVRDITPIASFSRGPGVIVVKPSFPAKTVPDLIAYAKANPGKVNMASAG